MKRIFSSLLITTFAIFGLTFVPNISNAAESAAPVYDSKYNNNSGAFYANGTPITIDEKEGSTVITWDDGSQIITDTTYVFGGGASGTNFNSSNITMNNGTVAFLYGGGTSLNQTSPANVNVATITINGGNITKSAYAGGRFYSTVNTASTTINNGTINSLSAGGAASGSVDGIWYDSGTEESPQESGTRVNNSTITLNNGTISSLWGGGQGYSYTGKSFINIYNGTIDYLTAGGANGYTKDVILKIFNGNIKVYQSVNRGLVDSVKLTTSGGDIDTFYVAGENAPDVNGTLNNSEINILSGKITNLNAGLNSGVPLIIKPENHKIIFTDNVIKNNNIKDGEISKIDFSMSITPSTCNLFVNQTQKLNVTIKTEPSGYESKFEDVLYTWESLDSSVATVDNNGIVTGIQPGTTDITATLNNKTANSTINISTPNTLLIILIAFIILGVILILLFLLLLLAIV